MKKKLLIIIALLTIIVLPYQVKAATGNLNISCSPDKVNSNETTKCTISGSIDTEITAISLDINPSSNLQLVSFTPSNTWSGDDIDNGKIDVYTNSGDTIKNNFTLGTIDVKVKDNIVNSNEKISLSNIIFYYDKTEYNIDNASDDIRIPSNINTLTNITVNNKNINFQENNTTYNLTVESDSAKIAVTKKDSNSTVTGDGTQKLNYGKNTFNIVVTSESGSKKTYTLNITRPDSRSKENYLLNFSFYNYDIGFNKDKTSYELTVENNVSRFGNIIYYNKLPSQAAIEELINKYKINNSLLTYTYEFVHSADTVDLKLNEKSLYNLYDDLDGYLDDIDNSLDELEKKCNDDETSCSYYMDGNLVYKETETEEYIEYAYYRNNEIVWVGDNDVDIAIPDNLKVGTNILEIVIAAENGDERTYTFKINRKTEDGKILDEIPSSPQTGSTMIIIVSILLVISLGVVVYFVYKNNKENKK